MYKQRPSTCYTVVSIDRVAYAPHIAVTATPLRLTRSSHFEGSSELPYQVMSTHLKSREQIIKRLGQRRVGKDSIPQNGIRYFAHDRHLQYCHDLAAFNA